MNKNFVAIVLLSLISYVSLAQVVDRYPYVQSPDEHSVIIAWRNATAGIGTIAYGLSATSLTDTLRESSATQKHMMLLTGLASNQKYYYQVHTIGHAPYPIEYFSTAMPDSNNHFKFLHYGDCGFNSTIQHDIATLMNAEDVDFGVVTGDVDQGAGTAGGDNYDDIFFQIYTNQLAKQCHFTAIGNHDTYFDGAATYLESFYLPHNNPANTERYYSFIWGNAKFICLDPHMSYAAGSAQYRWLEDELRCNDKEWLFCFFHEPAWTNYWSLDYLIPFTDYFMYGGNADMRTTIVPLFEQYDVDYVLNGHTHLYQKGEANGVKYIISGGSGQDPTTNTETQWNTYSQVQLVLKISEYVKFEINGDTANFKCIDINGTIRDQETKYKPYTPYHSTITTNNVSCKGLSDGTASISTVGPKAPYTYEWSTGDTLNAIDSLAAGNYSVTVYDKYNCAKIETFTITQPDSLSILFNLADATCTEIHDGAITAIVSGGTNPYTYSWNTGDTTNAIDSLSVGTYNLLVTDLHGCTLHTTETIHPTYTPSPTITGDSIFCLGDSIILETGLYTSYSWNTGESVNPISINNPGMYKVTITDSIGCIGISDNFYVKEDSLPVASFNFANVLRNFNFLSFTLNGDSYEWNFGDGSANVITTTRSTVNHVYSTADIFNVTLIVSNYCGSDTISRMVSSIGAGIESNETNGTLEVSPNPFSDFTFIKLPVSKDLHLVIYDSQGKIILEENSLNQVSIYTFESTNLPTGVYYINAFDEQHTWKAKVVKK
ncbi:MAG: metallophosphoesterase [Bacteroidota bacterium]